MRGGKNTSGKANFQFAVSLLHSMDGYNQRCCTDDQDTHPTNFMKRCILQFGDIILFCTIIIV